MNARTHIKALKVIWKILYGLSIGTVPPACIDECVNLLALEGMRYAREVGVDDDPEVTADDMKHILALLHAFQDTLDAATGTDDDACESTAQSPETPALSGYGGYL